jgi:hypothetical protein
MGKLYKVYGGPAPTTAAQATVATGTAIKTLIQIATGTTRSIEVVEWGISFDGTNASNTPIKCELIDTAAIAATITAYVAADIHKFSHPSDEASTIQIGTTALSGYNASAEGTIVASRVGDAQLINPTAGLDIQWPLNRGFVVSVSRFLRVRVTASASVNAYPYVIWEE